MHSRVSSTDGRPPPSSSPDSLPSYVISPAPSSAPTSSPSASPNPSLLTQHDTPAGLQSDDEPILSASRPFTAAPSTTRIVQSHSPHWNALYRYPNNHITNTKYTPWTFLPLSLYNQCRLAMNKYFLLIALLQLWPYITPVNPVTTWVPLGVIFAISTVKEGVDDWRRWRQDRTVNRRRVTIVTGLGEVECASEEVQCGDVVKVVEGEEFCADMVLLASSERSGGCWIETSNVDGETNLKGRVALPETQRLTEAGSSGGDGGLGRLKCTVECAVPNKNIYGFDSTITLNNGSTLALSAEQLLLQGTTLCNTTSIYGLVVYTGNETKVGQNKNIPRHKYTTLDSQIDTTIVTLFALQCLFIVVWGVTGSCLLYIDVDRPVWYLHLGDERWYDPAVIPLRFLLLASMMIPISLKVTLDLVKVMYSLWIRWDLGMWDERNGVGAEARNTALAEELGCVQYVMTDKTGTLTENVMVMKEMATRTRQYRAGDETGRGSGNEATEGGLSGDSRLQADVREEEKEVTQLLRCLMLCNTVVPSHKQPTRHSNPTRPTSSPTSSSSSSSPATTPSLHYSSSSPDELCLVQFAASVGFTLESRDNQLLSARSGVDARSDQWTVLAVCDFTSTRKRMSVILQDSSGRIQLLMKGADDVMFARIRRDRDEQKSGDSYKAVVDGYGRKGLRTLVFGQRDISEAEWKEWSARHHKASLDIARREQSLADVYEQIERDVSIVGVSGIEDKLQEGVEETLVMLRKAGIKVWMLTGDKQQTAEEIGKSSGLIARQDRILYLNAPTRTELATSLERISRDVQSSSQSASSSSSSPPYVLIIDGATLSLCLLTFPDLFYNLSSSATSVICCRCTPSQKGGVTALMVDRHHVTLGIGDGANDLNLIQTANVGVGISGREGMQAARASDFSISQFSHLRRLLLVHGRWSYTRTAWIAQYCLYKSLIIAFVQLAFAFVSRFSGASFFDSFSLVSYNLFYTSVLGVFYLFEQDVSADTLLKRPELYATTRERHNYTAQTVLYWLCRSLYQSAFISLVTWCTALGTTAEAGLGDSSQIATALTAYSSIVLIQCFTLYVEMTFIVVWVHVIVIVTITGFITINLIVSAEPSNEANGVFMGLLGDPVYWLSVVLCVLGCLLPVIGVKYWWRTERPSQVDLVHDEEVAEAVNKRGRTTSGAGLLSGGAFPSYDTGNSSTHITQPATKQLVNNIKRARKARKQRTDKRESRKRLIAADNGMDDTDDVQMYDRNSRGEDENGHVIRLDVDGEGEDEEVALGDDSLASVDIEGEDESQLQELQDEYGDEEDDEDESEMKGRRH